MQKKRAFTLIELLVVISIIALLIGILLPALGAARKAARQMQGSTYVRGIHSGLVLYAAGNGDYYTGLASDGGYSAGSWVTSQGRAATLVNSRFFQTEYAQSPAESSYAFPGSLPSSSYPGIMTSYAMEQVTNGDSAGAGQQGIPDDTITGTTHSRANSWRNNTKSLEVIISDRLVSLHNGNSSLYQSIHTSVNGDWRGSVGYNDNHVVFQPGAILTTQFTGDAAQNDHDNLFGGGGQSSTNIYQTRHNGTGSSGNDASQFDDALMCWESTIVVST